ncbi:YdbC family protein [Streptomyces sp. PTM05]|uniref:YdbC family protein n=1 Tax=Streptantibioticus parmotrematis TaxID=2873249 RepID=A0ABS7QVC7_9ACTN|nr:YdbC family protein [Streptantibioticus parmotrematis]MBY8887170.1 YdbC family protein [Streptantibioticus parmotrematis]
MLVKWIRCRVVDRVGFDQGQRQWAGLRGEPGFRGQGGGWARGQREEAHVFCFWESREYYDRFMAGPHDGFAREQAASYDRIDVRLFEQRQEVKVGFRADFADADVLRAAHCRVRPAQVEHFMLMQEKVWNPAMAGSPGMLRGIFAEGAGSEFLVLSMWDSATERGKYRDAAVGRLEERAGLDEDVLSVTGEIVDVVRDWTV